MSDKQIRYHYYALARPKLHFWFCLGSCTKARGMARTMMARTVMNMCLAKVTVGWLEAQHKRSNTSIIDDDDSYLTMTTTLINALKPIKDPFLSVLRVPKTGMQAIHHKPSLVLLHRCSPFHCPYPSITAFKCTIQPPSCTQYLIFHFLTFQNPGLGSEGMYPAPLSRFNDLVHASIPTLAPT